MPSKVPMNRENVKLLIDTLKKEDSENFDMLNFYDESVPLVKIPRTEKAPFCGTTACIAGHAAALATAEKFKDEVPEGESLVIGIDTRRVAYDAYIWLGLPRRLCHTLFFPEDICSRLRYGAISKEMAIQILTELYDGTYDLDTGFSLGFSVLCRWADLIWPNGEWKDDPSVLESMKADYCKYFDTLAEKAQFYREGEESFQPWSLVDHQKLVRRI